jgi:hypothetical protein
MEAATPLKTLAQTLMPGETAPTPGEDGDTHAEACTCEDCTRQRECDHPLDSQHVAVEDEQYLRLCECGALLDGWDGEMGLHAGLEDLAAQHGTTATELVERLEIRVCA